MRQFIDVVAEGVSPDDVAEVLQRALNALAEAERAGIGVDVVDRRPRALPEAMIGLADQARTAVLVLPSVVACAGALVAVLQTLGSRG